MSPPVFHRRRAERFAQLLEEASGGRRHHVHSPVDEDLTELVAVGHRVSALQPAIEVDPNFRGDLRAMLIATAEREGIGATVKAAPLARSPRRPTKVAPVRALLSPVLAGPRSRVRGAIIMAVAAGAITVSGISAASDNSVPGDALYGVKRSAEDAQLAFSGSDQRRGQLHLDFARTRLAEAQAMTGDADARAAVLDEMDAETREGVKLLTTSALQHKDETELNPINTFLAEQRPQVAGLPTGRDSGRAKTSLALLDSVAKRVDAVRASLACGAGTPVRTDSLGPQPGTCG